ncbi:MAG: TRAFs-binding domain-containing protein [Candidatus Competibacteraceae bacterium]
MATKTCFVIQGFGVKTDFTTGRTLDLDKSYRIIKKAVEAAGLKCIRADEIKHSQAIDIPMYEQLLNADLVIADLSTYNMNAAYEVGVRYGLRPQATIIVAENQFVYPFDVGHMVILPYEHLGKGIEVEEAERFQSVLTEAITAIINAQKVDSPVYTFLQQLQPPFLQSEPLQAEQKAEVVITPSVITTDSKASSELVSDQLPDSNAKQLLELARDAMAESNFIVAKSLFQALQLLRPNDHYVVHQLALATYKSKQPNEEAALDEACKLLETLNPATTNDPETLGLWGSTHKRLWELTQDRAYLNEAITAYERGFYLKQDYYNGINFAYLLNVRAALEEQAGSTAEAIADFVRARRARREVISLCNATPATDVKSADDNYWIAATLWEAAVGLEDPAEIAKYKALAETAATADWMLETTRAQIVKLEGLLAVSPLKHLTPT